MRTVLLLLGKELREFVRDRRVLVGAILLPMGLVVVVSLFLGAMHGFLDKPGASEIAVLDPDLGKTLLDTKVAKEAFRTRKVPTLEAGLALVRKKDVRMLVAFGGDVAGAVGGGKPVEIKVYLDKKSLPAQLALARLEAAAQVLNAKRRAQVLADKQLRERDLEPIRVEAVATTEAQEFGGDTVSTLLPYLLVVFAFFGGMSLAADSVAGEKERGTLETLLVSPAGRVQIALGKLLSMATVCLTSSISGLVGLLVVVLPGSELAKPLLKGGIHVSLGGTLASLLTMLPLVVMFSAVLTAVSAFSRNQREANTYTSAISFVVMVPAIASQFIGFTDLATKLWIGFVPVLNSAMVIRQILMGELHWAMFALTMLTSCVLAGAAFLAVVLMFRRESVLFRV